MKYEFEIKEISRFNAAELIQSLHYSKIMPKLTKHFLGCFLDDELVGVLTLGWGTQPKATINKLFEGLDTKDYFEIGKMCMKEEMPKNSETQMISGVIKWLKKNHPGEYYDKFGGKKPFNRLSKVGKISRLGKYGALAGIVYEHKSAASVEV